MSIRVPVFVPAISRLLFLPSANNASVIDLLNAIWERVKVRLEEHEVKFSALSIRSLYYPVPLKPRDTLHKRVGDCARDKGWAPIHREDEVPSVWSDPENLHIILYVDLGAEVRAAEKLKETLWGKELDVILKEVSVDEKTTYRFVPKEQIKSLDICELGYSEPLGLLIRPEYDTAFEMMEHDRERATARNSGGVVVTGQPGAGKTSFLYYLLFRLLCKMTPVVLQLREHFIVFQDDGVHKYRLRESSNYLPEGCWALSDSGGQVEQPCGAFLEAARRGIAWIVQTTFPSEKGWKEWRKQLFATKFVVDYFSIDEITALGKLFELDIDNLKRIYKTWGPSVHTCMWLSRQPAAEDTLEKTVETAAHNFVRDPVNHERNFDPTGVSHVLFSLRPEDKTEAGRMIFDAYIATDRIRNIISYAAAEAKAHERIYFYRTIEKQPTFRTSAGNMFKRFVFSWLTSGPYVGTLDCTAAKSGEPNIQIPACTEERTFFFGSLTGLKDATVDGFPSCFLPTSQTLAAVDAIVFTTDCIITVQVTISDSHSAEGKGFDDIKTNLPSGIMKDHWYHVFVTDKEVKARSLRHQMLSELPKNILLYYGVFDLGLSDITSAKMRVFNENKQRACDNSTHDNSIDISDGEIEE